MDRRLYLPVLSDWFPFHDMLLDNYLRVGGYDGVYTKNWGWDYRGWVLFYNSYETFGQCASIHGYQDEVEKHGVIIGIGKLVEVRKINESEKFELIRNYNNWTPRFTKLVLSGEKIIGSNYIKPLDIGFFFQNLRRFSEAIPFNKPPKSERFGSVFSKVKISSRLRQQITESI